MKRPDELEDRLPIADPTQNPKPNAGGGKGNASPPKQKVDWVQWALIGLLAIVIASAIFL